jgi:hypothetical protein
VSLSAFPADFTPLSLACVGWPQFACTLQPHGGSGGRVMLFSLTCTKKHPLGKSRNAPRVDAFYCASTVCIVSTGNSIPACITRGSGAVSFFTANEKVGDAVHGFLKSVNWTTKHIGTVAAGFTSVFGVDRLDQDVVVSDAGDNRLWLVSKTGSKRALCGSGQEGTDDGLANECDLRVPLGVAVPLSGKTTFFVQGDGRLRMFSFTGQMCKFMRTTREFAEVFGIMDPRTRTDKAARDSLRSVPFTHAVDTLQNIVLDRSDWYNEARKSLCLPSTAKGLKGPEGVPAFTTFAALECGVDDLRHTHNSLSKAGLQTHANSLRTHLVNDMNIEHRFGLIALGHDHMQSQQSFLPLLDRSREEMVASMCVNEFSHSTTLTPYAPYLFCE